MQLARERGLSRQAGRGHARTPERPERAYREPQKYERYLMDRPERLANVPPGQLAAWNLLRALEGKHEIAPNDPGDRGGRRQFFPTFEAAEEYSRVIPIGYVTLFPEGGAWATRVNRKAA